MMPAHMVGHMMTIDIHSVVAASRSIHFRNGQNHVLYPSECLLRHRIHPCSACNQSTPMSHTPGQYFFTVSELSGYPEKKGERAE